MTNSLRSPKNKYRVGLFFSKPLSGIGSSDSYTTNSLPDADSDYIKRSKRMAEKSGASLSVVVWENKSTFPEFNWVEVARFKA